MADASKTMDLRDAAEIMRREAARMATPPFAEAIRAAKANMPVAAATNFTEGLQFLLRAETDVQALHRMHERLPDPKIMRLIEIMPNRFPEHDFTDAYKAILYDRIREVLYGQA